MAVQIYVKEFASLTVTEKNKTKTIYMKMEKFIKKIGYVDYFGLCLPYFFSTRFNTDFGI